MITRDVLMDWVLEALRDLGGQGSVLDVSKRVWQRHGQELQKADDLFYTWQYDLRWAAQKLRNAGKLKPVDDQRGLPWTLAEHKPS